MQLLTISVKINLKSGGEGTYSCADKSDCHRAMKIASEEAEIYESDLGPQSSHYIHNENFKEGHGQLFNMVHHTRISHTCVCTHTHTWFFLSLLLGVNFLLPSRFFFKEHLKRCQHSQFPFSFLRLTSILLYVHTTFSLSIHLCMDI